jgi:hypothetical protein
LQAVQDLHKDRDAAQMGLSLLANLAKGSREPLLGAAPAVVPVPAQLLEPGAPLPGDLAAAAERLRAAQAELAAELARRWAGRC